jgi:hypothetical protein
MFVTIESVAQRVGLNASRFGNEGKNMFVTIENNRVIVNLDEIEFPMFQAMLH